MSLGRPTDYTPELVDEICQRVALGENLNVICLEESMPSQDTVYRWRHKYPEFSEKYQSAREERSNARSDRIDDWCRQVAEKKLEPAAANVIISAEKWQAGRENPKRYGDKITQEVTGVDGEPLNPETDSKQLAREIAFILAKGLEAKPDEPTT